MPPRHQTLPPAQTSSARQALQSFYCDLCAKGYSRMNDYEAHLGSYDHSHRQRMKDMKQMVKDPTAGARARRAEAKADGLISIKIPSADTADDQNPAAAATSGFKKGGFKKSGFKSAFAPVATATTANTTAEEAADTKIDRIPIIPGHEVLGLDVESDTDDDFELYDPRFPTD
ncbi:hypothetical protein GGR57DRAFT_156799 [Xylariaceae sp. FL1272]|nr:hypothetical protein GGR57DRAFT_156799 [Xylariaceae sp. FL1272]